MLASEPSSELTKSAHHFPVFLFESPIFVGINFISGFTGTKVYVCAYLFSTQAFESTLNPSIDKKRNIHLHVFLK